MKKIAVLLFILTIAGCNQNPKNIVEAHKNNITDSLRQDSIFRVQADSMMHAWIYTGDTDQMRSIINRYATIHSTDGSFSLIVRKKDNVLDIYFNSQGDIFDKKYILCRFDKDSIEEYGGGESQTATALFLENDKNKFIRNLKTHKKLIIEADLYGKKQQSVFNITGLKWD